MNKSLLQRIAMPQQNSLIENVTSLKEDIRRNLMRLFNARQGSVLLDPRYGLPAFDDLISSYPESASKMKKAIWNAVKNHEPRIEISSIDLNKNNNDLSAISFEISAQIVNSKQKQEYIFETNIDFNGRINVNEE